MSNRSPIARSSTHAPSAPQIDNVRTLPRFNAGWGSGVAVLRFRGGVEDRRHRLVGLDGDLLLVVDGDLGEQGLVEHASL